MRIVVAVLGSFRQKDHVRQVFDGIESARQGGPPLDEVVVSTTDDRSKAEQVLAEIGVTRSVRLVQSPPPPFVARGHRLHQMRQLHNALEGLSPDTWVLKLRTDKLVLPPTLLTACLRQVADDPERYAGRFGVLEGHIFLPWFVNDMAFLGQARTLREIVSFDVSVDIFAPNLFTEQAIWSVLAGAEREAFFAAARRFPFLTRLAPEGEGADIDECAALARTYLRPYWNTLFRRFFAISNHRFRDVFPLSLGGMNIRSDRVFTRYGAWGASFTDPNFVEDLLAQDAAAAGVGS